MKGNPHTEIEQHDWHERLTSGAFDPVEKAISDELRNGVAALGDKLIANLPNGRERALALTHLEEALMWTNKAIARGV